MSIHEMRFDVCLTDGVQDLKLKLEDAWQEDKTCTKPGTKKSSPYLNGKNLFEIIWHEGVVYTYCAV